MKKPPAKRPQQPDHIKSAVRFPPDVHAAISAAAVMSGRSLNAEVISRLREDRLAEVLHELTELKQMVRQLLDRK